MRNMMLATLLAAIGTHAHAGEADLIGTYIARYENSAQEFVKIEREGKAYVIYDKGLTKTWSKSKLPLAPISKEQFRKLVQGPTDVPFDGLGNENVSVIKVPAGWTDGTFKTKSGYFLVWAMGLMELEKQ